MFQVIIDFKKTLDKDTLKRFTAEADKAFDNHAGCVRNSSDDPYRLVYEGDGNDMFCCLGVGFTDLGRTQGFIECLSAWQWIDTDNPAENDDLLRLYAQRAVAHE